MLLNRCRNTADLISRLTIPVLLFVAVGMAAGCSSSSDVTESQRAKPMPEHEKTFDPSAYRETKPKKSEESTPTEAPASEKKPRVKWVERIEKTMGFRIQLHSTTNIDDAQNQLSIIRRKLDSLDIASGRLDMTFDAPYYKVRLGDFLVKPPADSLRDVLREHGLSEAWVVRDRVNRIIREPAPAVHK